jgi:ribose/xylose/arabinose/galactoside ABC-type transport system permease subunit
LVGYIDASFAEELTGRKSHYGYVFFFIGGVIVHQSKRQSIIATLSTYTKYVALCKIAQKAEWLRLLLAEL